MTDTLIHARDWLPVFVVGARGSLKTAGNDCLQICILVSLGAKARPLCLLGALHFLRVRLLGETDSALHFIFLRHSATSTLTLLVNWHLLLRVLVLLNLVCKKQFSCIVDVALGLL